MRESVSQTKKLLQEISFLYDSADRKRGKSNKGKRTVETAKAARMTFRLHMVTTEQEEVDTGTESKTGIKRKYIAEDPSPRLNPVCRDSGGKHFMHKFPITDEATQKKLISG